MTYGLVTTMIKFKKKQCNLTSSCIVQRDATKPDHKYKWLLLQLLLLFQVLLLLLLLLLLLQLWHLLTTVTWRNCHQAIQIHLCIYIYIITYPYPYPYTCTYAYPFRYTNTSTYTITDIHTHIYTYVLNYCVHICILFIYIYIHTDELLWMGHMQMSWPSTLQGTVSSHQIRRGRRNSSWPALPRRSGDFWNVDLHTQ